MKSHPPRWQHPNKQAVFDAVLAARQPFVGKIIVTRWPEAELPKSLARRGRFRVQSGVFSYPAAQHDVEWHMNFADSHLFVAYGSDLLAQDELQVAEHPILGAVREALVFLCKPPETMDGRGRPTPITISGVQRHCAIDTLPRAGHPQGLYGNAFARATAGVVRSATSALSPPSLSNILAMTAPAGGYGAYSRDEIDYILSAAYSGFLAARRESEGIGSSPPRTTIHTGFWGCGAFGGNRILMTILQVLAAELADVDVEFHAVNGAGVSLAREACAFYERIREATSTVSQALEALLREGFVWGESNGT